MLNHLASSSGKYAGASLLLVLLIAGALVIWLLLRDRLRSRRFERSQTMDELVSVAYLKISRAFRANRVPFRDRVWPSMVTFFTGGLAFGVLTVTAQQVHWRPGRLGRIARLRDIQVPWSGLVDFRVGTDPLRRDRGHVEFATAEGATYAFMVQPRSAFDRLAAIAPITITHM